MAILQAHLAPPPTFLARLNYGDNTCRPGFVNNYSETISPFNHLASSTFKIRTGVPLQLPEDVTALHQAPWKTAMVPIHLPLCLYKPIPVTFF
jgi:hypothetical protein